jgi:hypothetical protein
MNAIHARSQLRYWPTVGTEELLMLPVGSPPVNAARQRAGLHGIDGIDGIDIRGR